MLEMISKKTLVVVVAIAIAVIAIIVISNLTGRNVVNDIYSLYNNYYKNLADCDKEQINKMVKKIF